MTSNIDPRVDEVAELRATVASLEEQLIALYAEKQYGLWPQQGSAGTPDELEATVANLDAMYCALLEERNELLAEGGAEEMRQTIANLDAMYAAMLEERNELLADGGLATTVANLDAMYAAMLEERNELQQSLIARSAQTERAKQRLVDLMTHVVEQEFQTH